ncbi:MAG: dCTP deaminase domain-containing protein [Nitrososphaeraceae archaeon]
MLINPKIAIQEGWITWNENIIDIEKYVQPNAMDFDCAKISSLNTNDDAFLNEDSKKMRGQQEVNPIYHTEYGNVWLLKNFSCYDFMSNFYVQLPAGVAAELIIRSSLNRNGTFLTSGLYDAGFQGHIAGTLRVGGGDMYLAPNTRIGQIKFVKSDISNVLYAGGYNHEQGTHWSENNQLGQKQIAHNPNRTDVGMGPILDPNSRFL